MFSGITSPATSTTKTFKYILNSNVLNNKEAKKWYEYPNIVEIMKVAGYHSYWISNQAETGIWDNVPSSTSAICDGKTFNKEYGKLHDSFVLKPMTFDNELFSSDTCIVFYHLMGQHPAYKSRYPQDFTKYKAADYSKYPKTQRQNRADYDNATLYNDYIVSSIIDKYKNQDAIIFYFSDHGLDHYDVDSDYSGHGREGIPASKEIAVKIPFMIYVTEHFKEKHHDAIEKIAKIKDKHFCTDSFIFYLLDLTGFKLKG